MVVQKPSHSQPASATIAAKRTRSCSTSSSSSLSSEWSSLDAVESRAKRGSAPRRSSGRSETGPLGRDTTPMLLEPLTLHRLQIRQKQIDYGKNTLGYDEYRKRVPKSQRAAVNPATPDIHQKCSRRSWDGQIKKWRKLLHQYDTEQAGLSKRVPPETIEQVAVERDLMQSILGQGSEDDMERRFIESPKSVGCVSVVQPQPEIHIGVDEEFLDTFFGHH